MKLTDEQLSRALTAHACGGLKRGGWANGVGRACLFQITHEYDDDDWTYDYDAADLTWFDQAYDPTWTVDMFLTQLEIRGLA